MPGWVRLCGLVVLLKCLGSAAPSNAALKFKLEDVSGGAGLVGVNGYVAAVADMNNDHFADLLVVNAGVCTILAWDDERFKERVKLQNNGTIHSVLPADFDGDGKVDVLLCTEDHASSDFTASPHYSLLVYWGTALLGAPTVVSDAVAAPPVLLDIDLDLLADIVIPDGEASPAFCGSSDRNFKPCSDKLPSDVHHRLDRVPALVFAESTPVIASLSYNESESVRLNAWKATENHESIEWRPVTKGSNALPIGGVSLVGVETWQDMDLDGTLDLLLPVCWDPQCYTSSILVFFVASGEAFLTEHMKPVAVDLWKLSPRLRLDASRVVPATGTKLLPTLRCGDLDLDGFVDAVIVGVVGDEKKAVFLHNVACFTCGDGITRTLEATVMDVGGSGVLSISFFDLKANGIPDLLLSRGNSSVSSMAVLQQRNIERNAFVKVVVASCVSPGSCVSQPGTSVLGTRVTYHMTHPSLSQITSSSLPLLSQVGTMTLQMPAVILGLGRPITYLRSMAVQLPSPPGKTLSHQWPAIIPNSKVLIVANPPTQPAKWEARLLLNAGQAVWQTALVFTCICIILTFLFIILRRREVKEDELEKKEQSHQFHFDAM